MTITHTKSQLLNSSKQHWRIWLYLLLLGLLVYALIPNYRQLISGVSDIRRAQLDWVLLALFGLVSTNLVAALTYVILGIQPINFFATVMVQWASSFTNRLLPGGLGGVGLYIYYLIKKGYQLSGAVALTVMNSVLSITSHFILLLLAIYISHPSMSKFVKNNFISYKIVLSLIVIALIVLVVIGPRQKIIKLLSDIWANLWNYRHHLRRLLLGLIAAGSITLFYVGTFYACAHAMNLALTFLQAFLIYTVGVLLGAVSLTPGGLGGVEAGLVVGLVAFNYNTSLAFAVVVIYRLITFWLPIVPGYLTWQVLRHNKEI